MKMLELSSADSGGWTWDMLVWPEQGMDTLRVRLKDRTDDAATARLTPEQARELFNWLGVYLHKGGGA